MLASNRINVAPMLIKVLPLDGFAEGLQLLEEPPEKYFEVLLSMKTETLNIELKKQSFALPLHRVHTLVIGSGAAGLNAAIQLQSNGIEDLAIVTEGLHMGTSINTGSDKQTYYKLGMCGAENDSPQALAETLFAGGSMHGDLALIEASLSARAFMGLVNLGVPFPTDRYGQFVGYKTDHDPRQRATSVGPYTSREMCRLMIAEVGRRRIAVHEKRLVVALLTAEENGRKRSVGALVLNCENEKDDPDQWVSAFEVYAAENVVLAVGGPGGLYQTSVYPKVHTGAIGLALLQGAVAHNLNESQFGMSSIQFRWNVSGTFMQCVPRFISTAADGVGAKREFLVPYFTNPGHMHSMIFLKGYQWPFHSTKVAGGSSIIDLLVYIERVVKGRRVFLDFRQNPVDFDFKQLQTEALEYLQNSKALDKLPIERLRTMNPAAIQLYHDHGIDITREPLEIAVCAQHNNGGLAASIWWESVNLPHLFPIGEVNGTHGITRPGGAALNSGQVGGYRAAEYIANVYRQPTLTPAMFEESARETMAELDRWLAKSGSAAVTWQADRDEFQTRMSRAGAHIRSSAVLSTVIADARDQWRRLQEDGCRIHGFRDLMEGLRNLQLCYAHLVYLNAIHYSVESGIGSRGSALVLDESGESANEMLDDQWRFAPEDTDFRNKVLRTTPLVDGGIQNEWETCRPLPQSDNWFETAWATFRNKDIYTQPG